MVSPRVMNQKKTISAAPHSEPHSYAPKCVQEQGKVPPFSLKSPLHERSRMLMKPAYLVRRVVQVRNLSLQEYWRELKQRGQLVQVPILERRPRVIADPAP